MSREGSDPGSRIAAVAAAVLLAGIAAPALVAFAHADPFIEPGYGASPNPVGQGQFTTLQAAVSCALPGCGPAYAEAYILPEMAAVFPGAGNHDDPAKNGLSMTPSDGLWNADTEFTSVVNDTAWLALGAHTVYLRGQGCGGFPTCWSEWATFTLTVDLPTTDTSAPAQSNPHYEPDNVISSGENSVTLVGTFDDTGDPGNATVGGAEYWFSGCGIPFIGGTPMSARDGAFDGATEDAVSLLDVTGWPDGTYVFFMRGWDSLGNDATSCISAELYIQRTPTDTLGPLASSGGVTPSSVIQGGGPVDVSATIDDSTTGNSNVGGAEYFVDPDPLTGIPNPPPYVSDTGVNMLPTDGFWDTPTEGASKWSVDVSAWLPGIYTLSIHGRDRWGYWGDIGVAGEHTTATLTVGSPVPLPPTGLRASVSGSDVLVTWTVPSPASGLDHYNVYRGASASVCPAGALVATVPSGTTLYTHTAAAADANPYIYNVRSANAAGQEETNCEAVGKLPLALRAGVNEVSTPFEPTDTSPDLFFAPVWPSFLGVGAFLPVASGWTFYNKTGTQLLTTITNGMGLRVVMSAAATLPIVGHVPTAVAVPVAAGWNFLGYARFVPASAPTVLDANGLSGLWTKALARTGDGYDAWRAYVVGDPAFQDLGNLLPRQGFWVYCTAPGTWTPPPT